MPTLVYSPGVRAYIQTSRAGLVDVTEDIVSGQVRRVTGPEPSSWSLVLSNRARKYDGLFAPNDRVTIFLKRLYWLQSLSGYVNSTPYYNAKPGTVKIGGSCTLKYLQHFHWDPHTTASQTLINGGGPASVPGDPSGIPDAVERVKLLLTEVAEWDDDRIHIGNIPPSWQDFVDSVIEEVREAQDSLPTIGTLSVGGSGPYNLGVTHPDRANTDNPSIGVFRETEGKASHFGGPDDASTYGRNPALSGSERAPNWRDPWYLALRIPTQNWGSGSNDQMRGGSKASNITQSQYTEGRNWWTNRKVLVTNPENGRQFVGRVIDIGPNVRTGKAIDMSKEALEQTLQSTTGKTMTWTFASDSAPLGPVIATNAEATSVAARRGRLSLPSSIPQGASPSSGDFAWGGYSNGRIPEGQMTEVRQSNGANIYLHPIAAESYTQMRRAADKEGVRLLLTGGFRSYARQVSLKREKGAFAATPGTSNHGWGMAVDVNLGGGFDSKVYKWLQANGARYGWVNPVWARDASGIEEPWHWEFWGIFGAHQRAGQRDSSGQVRYQVDIQPGQFDELGNGIPRLAPTVGGSGSPITPSGAAPYDGDGGLFATDNWVTTGLQEDMTAVGPLLYSNDTPILPDVSALVSAAGRDMCSAPNGDFLSWFPDYFDLHGYAAVYDLVMMEVADFSVDWADTRLKTHFFVTGALGPGGAGPSMTGNITDPTTARHLSKGIASLEYPGLLKVLLGTEDEEAIEDTARLLKRFGVRPDKEQMDNLLGGDAEFYIAVTKFMRNWSEQFSATLPLTGFMPEIYPGMIARVSDLNFQAYVSSVTHTFDFTNGFNTSLGIIAPSRLDSQGLLGAALDAARELSPVGRKPPE